MQQTYTVKDVARILGYSTNSIYSFLKEKRIKGVRLGKGRFRIPQSEVNRLLGEKNKSISPGAIGQDMAQAVQAGIPSMTNVDSVEAVPVHYRIEMPSLFDWFSGIAATVAGLAVLLYRQGYEEYALSDFGVWMPFIAVLLVTGGLGLLLADITGYGKTIWQRLFRMFVIIGFGFLSALNVMTGDTGGLVLYSSLTFTSLLSSITPFPGIVLFALYSGILTMFLPFTLGSMSGDAVIGNLVPQGYLQNQAQVWWIPALSVISLIAWRSYMKKRFFFWIFVVMCGIVQIGIAFVSADHLLWGRSFLYALSAVISLFLPSWDSLIFTKRADRKLSFSVFFLVLGIFALALLMIHTIGESILTYTRAEMLSKVGYAAVSMDNVLTSARSSVGSAGINPIVLSELASAKRTDNILGGIVRSLYESNSALTHISLLEKDATVIVSYPLTAPGHDAGYAGRDLVLDAFATGRTVVSGSVAAAGGREGLVEMAVPVMDDGGEPLGLFVGGVSLKHIGTRLQNLSSSVTGEKVAITDAQGQVLFGEETTGIRGVRYGAEDSGQGITEINEGGQRQLVAYRKADSGPWYIVLSLPVEDVFRLAHSATYMMLVVTIIPLCLYMLFLLFHRIGIPRIPEDSS